MGVFCLFEDKPTGMPAIFLQDWLNGMETSLKPKGVTFNRSKLYLREWYFYLNSYRVSY